MVECVNIESVYRHPGPTQVVIVLGHRKINLGLVRVETRDAWDEFIIAFVVLPNPLLRDGVFASVVGPGFSSVVV